MPNETPGAYDEARNRTRENKEKEKLVIEERRETFEKGKERLRSQKKLDVYELKRRIETGHSLHMLKSDIQSALESGQISIDTYTNALNMIDEKNDNPFFDTVIPEYTLPPGAFPLSDTKLAQYFDNQKFGDNPLIDIAGFAYGFFQGSLFLFVLLGRMIIDILLLPRDISELIKKQS